jgi:hypothetical protein
MPHEFPCVAYYPSNSDGLVYWVHHLWVQMRTMYRRWSYVVQLSGLVGSGCGSLCHYSDVTA